MCSTSTCRGMCYFLFRGATLPGVPFLMFPIWLHTHVIWLSRCWLNWREAWRMAGKQIGTDPSHFHSLWLCPSVPWHYLGILHLPLPPNPGVLHKEIQPHCKKKMRKAGSGRRERRRGKNEKRKVGQRTGKQFGFLLPHSPCVLHFFNTVVPTVYFSGLFILSNFL